MSDNLDKYLPEFDEDEVRAKLAGFTREQLLDMLVYAYKEKRVWAKSLGEEQKKLSRIQEILAEPSRLLGMPGIPTDDDLRHMIDDEDD
jgi:hypothetical protein